MKTNKILAIALSCLLLIGAVVGITAFAGETDPAVEIYAANVSYDSEIRILYAVDAANVPEGASVKVAFTANADAAAPAVGAPISGFDFVASAEAETVTIDEKTLAAVYSEGFAPADIRTTVYAIPAIVGADGNVVAAGAKKAFSVYDYFLSRIDSGDYTAEQYALYVAALDLGGSIQAAQVAGGAAAPANGYADAYYILKVMDETGKVTAQAFREPTTVNLTAPETYNEKAFGGFVDANGDVYRTAVDNTLAIDVEKIGTTFVKYTYGVTTVIADNLDTVTAAFGTEYFFEGDITLDAGTKATLALDPSILKANLTEADGVITVDDGVSAFTMANGAKLRVEYVVLDAEAKTGTVFYYVNGAVVKQNNVTSEANNAYVSGSVRLTGTVANAVAGAKAFDIVLGASAESTYLFTYDATGKFLQVKHSEGNAAGAIDFVYAGTAADHMVFELYVKHEGSYAANTWRNWVDYMLSEKNTQDFRFELNGTTAVQTSTGDINQTNSPVVTLDPPIAENGWFTLKVDYVAGGEYNVYIDETLVFTGVSADTPLSFFRVRPGNAGARLDLAGYKFYGVEETKTFTNEDGVTAAFGTEYFFEADVSLATGTVGTLAFNPSLGTITLTEANGNIIVADGVSSFEMLNGANLRVEYVVIDAATGAGNIFYYADGVCVAKSEVTSEANTAFDTVVAKLAGSIANVDLGAKAFDIVLTPDKPENTTVTFEYDATGKYVSFRHLNDSTAAGTIDFAYAGTAADHMIFEAELKYTGNWYGGGWRNYIDYSFDPAVLQAFRLAVTATAVNANKGDLNAAAGMTTTEVAIASDGWFTLKVDYVAGGEYTVYIDDVAVFTGTSNDTPFAAFHITPGSSGAGQINIKDYKFYAAE